MKIITLTDNSAFNRELMQEHGLSVYIEEGGRKILFDTGQTDVFLKNAEAIGIDLCEVDTVIISHGHYDHIGGLISLLEINKKAKVYLKKEIFDFQYFSKRRNSTKPIGYPLELERYKERFCHLNEQLTQVENLFFISDVEKNYPLPKGNKLLFKTSKEELTPDDFQHELIFGIDTEAGLCVFSGCAHSGILNMLLAVKNFFPNKRIKLIFGGLHLIDENEFVATETKEELREIAHEADRLSGQAHLYTGHCTGKNATEIFGEVFRSRFHIFYPGHQVEL